MFSGWTDWLFDPTGLTAHGFCLLWEPGLIWTHAIADIVIGLAYFTIPLALGLIARRRHDLVFKPVFWLFCAFILLCGAGHWLDLLTIWVPVYGIEGVVKAVTALVSIITAVGLWHLLPKVLAVNEALRTDITRSKENEAILRAARDAANAAARAKSEFLATMSHEIRSPMSGLVGVVELLQETALDAEQSRMTKMVHSSALALLGVLNDILDFSKIENNAMSIIMEPVNLTDLVTELAQPHLLEATRKGVETRLTISSEIPQYVAMDPMRLRQILNNVLSNAVKFTAAGTIQFGLSLNRAEPTPRLSFTVRDTGIGMSNEVLDRLFEPFMQADGSTTRDFGGTGLGLCICRRLAGLLDGTLTVSSHAGEGSTFTLLLPFIPSGPPVIAVAPRPPSYSLEGAGRILVVDDDPTNRWLTHRQLVRLGLTVETAENGEAAFDMLNVSHYDLMLTDCHMPRMDGMALTLAVRSSADPILRVLPIIGVTADVTMAHSERCQEAGMTDIALKPLNRDRLSQLLFRHLPKAAVVTETPLALPSAPNTPAQYTHPPAAPAGNPPAATLPSLIPDAPAASLPDAILFDEEIYRDLFSPGDAEGEVWLEEYLAASEGLHAELRQLLTAPQDTATWREDVAAAAHRLVGSSLSVGATSLSQIARGIEHASAVESASALWTRLQASHNDLIKTRQAMKTFIAAFQTEAIT